MHTTDSTAMNGRTDRGTFAPGNKAAAGRSSRAAELRKAFTEAITPEDIQAIASALVKAAKSGDIPAAKLLLDRVIGKCSVLDEPAGKPDDIGRNRIVEILARVEAQQ